ncbi:cytochrome c nitrite reductase small subunit [Pseudocnuella soli]|uniref:cytochrome c nitrite reductase small subunit n=1 Tax=Pseudocnuella soli TaxID=2502779 RepID=UPI00104F7AB6|nr:cytochrome c nitrite reductase small subunit [Pseudocnuella soli]
MGRRLRRIERFLFKYNLVPPHRWRRVAIVAVAAFIGLGLYMLKLSNAASYLSDDPQACVNCHLMTPQYLTWTHSSHREVAHCNDCHVPHDNVFNKYFFKAKDGLYHASIFTLRAEPQVIQAKSASVEVIHNNCIRCHQDQVTDAKLVGMVENHHAKRTDRLCWDCHREVPHGKVKSLSATGISIEPIRLYTPEDRTIVPAWLQKTLDEKNSKEVKK